MSRFCTLCPTSRMRDGTVHLHEIQPGERFRFEGQPQVFVLEDVTPSKAMIAPVGAAAAERVRFTPRFADAPVEFNRPASRSRPCAAGAAVERVS